METGPIIGIVVACVIVAIAVGAYLWYRARKSNGYHAVPTSDPYFPETDSKPISPMPPGTTVYRSADTTAKPTYLEPDQHYEHEDFYNPEFDMPEPSNPYGFLP